MADTTTAAAPARGGAARRRHKAKVHNMYELEELGNAEDAGTVETIAVEREGDDGDPNPQVQNIFFDSDSGWGSLSYNFLFPQSSLRRAWDFYIFCIVVYNIVLIPMRSTFPHRAHGALTWFWLSLDFFCDFSFVLDIIWRFFVGYNDMGLVVINRKKVIRKYLTGKFALDVAASLPFDIVFMGFQSDQRLRAMLRFNRFIRLYRIPQYFYYWERTTSRPNLFRLTKLLALVYLVAHWIACIFHEIVKYERYRYGPNFWQPSVNDPFREPWPQGLDRVLDKSVLKIYMRSLFWSITLLTGMGPDHNYPATDEELVFTGFVLTLGVLVFAAIIANVGQLLSSANATEEDFRKKMEIVNVWMKYKGIGSRLQMRIRSYYEYLWTRQAGLEDKLILDGIPDHLRAAISQELNKDIIRSVPFFKNCPDEGFLQEVTRNLRPEIYTPGDPIIREGEIGSCMFFITKGTVSVSVDGVGELSQLGQGKFFGELALLVKAKRNATVRAITFVDVFVLTKDAVDTALSEFPAYSTTIYEEARRLQDNERREAVRKQSLTVNERIRKGLSARGPAALSSSMEAIEDALGESTQSIAAKAMAVGAGVGAGVLVRPVDWLTTATALGRSTALREMDRVQLLQAQRIVAQLSVAIADVAGRQNS